MTDRSLLYATAFVRALATAMAGVMVGLYLATRGLDPAWIGAVVSAGLAGAACAALAVTLIGERLKRRRTLLALTALSVIGGVVFVVLRTPMAIALAAFVGMLNGMGRDRGAAAVVEQAILPTTVSDVRRTRTFAVYSVWQDAGHALGALLAGLPALLAVAGADRRGGRVHARHGHAGAAAGACASRSTCACRRRSRPTHRNTTWRARRASRPRAAVCCGASAALFALDSIAGGFLTTALMAYFFFERFGVGPVAIGALFFAARVANAVSHLAAAWLARRIGLLNTIVFTHLPSSLLLMTLPWAPNFTVAALLFLLREGLVEMDVPTRQSYVMAVVRPEERLTASGITSLVRLGGWAVAPAVAGALMQSRSLALPLFVGAAIKIAYDVMLYFAFRARKPPEEA